jgi:broad specificity phosphatase PhoE
MLTLVLSRHGSTPRSNPEQHLGQAIDIGLSEVGRDQATALGRRLAGVEVARILSSPLARARETATILRTAIPNSPTIEVDRRLAEMDYGDWEGLTYAEIEERDEAGRARWEDDPATIACPGGESGNDVAVRAEAFLVDLIAWHDALSGQPHDRPILAVAHSSLNRVLICVATGIPVREYRRRFSQDQTNLTVLRFEHGVGPADARILLLNDTAHLHPAGTVPWD